MVIGSDHIVIHESGEAGAGVGGGLIDTFSQCLESVHVNHSRCHRYNNAENSRGETEQSTSVYLKYY